MTNEQFAQSDPVFRKACELARVSPTRRQASKWHRREGLAVKFAADARKTLNGRLTSTDNSE